MPTEIENLCISQLIHGDKGFMSCKLQDCWVEKNSCILPGEKNSILKKKF